MTDEELADIDRKASEIERGPRPEEVDEDDSGERLVYFCFLIKEKQIEFSSGVKRPSENNQTHQTDDGNSNSKNNQTSRMHSGGDRRSDFRCDSDYNQPK